MTETTSPKPIVAGSGNRALAVVIDLFVLILMAGVISGLPAPARYLLVPLAFLYLAAMPLSPLQGTLGKWICRIKLCDRQGRRLTWRAGVLRAGATVVWFALPALFAWLATQGHLPVGQTLAHAWWLVFLLPWGSIGFRPRRESLFDLLAGSIVVTAKADVESIARTDPAPAPGIQVLSGLGTLLLCLGIGYLIQSMLWMMQSRSLYGRVVYAVNETKPLRAKIEAFHADKAHWPTAVELGVPEAVPYRDGGSYRVQANGSIAITFSVLPELKGRSLVFTPSISQDGYIQWQCRADTGLEKGYLPGICR